MQGLVLAPVTRSLHATAAVPMDLPMVPPPPAPRCTLSPPHLLQLRVSQASSRDGFREYTSDEYTSTRQCGSTLRSIWIV